ncbi:sigma-54-dependent transcriptional regulator [Jiella marina]|uniref:sigma-54-dependent transcriptional regulator n=1 Tax=Jiella sp. LLJ827 TaxID=2917712 RepID=UPI0021016E50|nr:sigma-54 dependent transcriptional regulator [Jiella sp. LLJ827]MCQ0988220.1 sigma-54 dependent transcriptional regulator [Jiella sp. LLJ827]
MDEGTTLPAILLVDDEPRSVEAMERILEDDFEVHRATSAAAAREILEVEPVRAIVCDQRMPDISGVDFLKQMRERFPDVVRIIITGYTDPSDIIRAINEAGIYQFVAKPWHPDELTLVVRNAVALNALKREHDRLSLELKLSRSSAEVTRNAKRAAVREGYGFEKIVRGPASPLNPALALAGKVAGYDVPALILGETGTGKELVARAIHYASARADRPFFAVHCGAIPDELLESELFGHRKGAFTGANATRVGLLEEADGGTVLLDEIGDVTPAFQLKLLRFLQEGEIRPVGANETRRVDVRVIAATNKDLKREAEAGRFREDLYYRLAVCPVTLPPLAERAGDIPLIAADVLERIALRHGISVPPLSPAMTRALSDRAYPGNVRELENLLMRLVIEAGGGSMEPDLLGQGDASTGRGKHGQEVASLAGENGARIALAAPPLQGDLRTRVEELEAQILRETLDRHHWNKSRAAEELGLSRVGLRAKLDRYGIVETDTTGPARQSGEASQPMH